jgi:acetyl esterase/lipase
MGNPAMFREQALRLARDGYMCIASEYRLTPESPWPAQIQDVKTALNWMLANADELHVDAARIGLVGRSAGAHLVLLAAGTHGVDEFEGSGGLGSERNPVAAVCGVFAPVAFYLGEDRSHGGTPARALMGDSATEAQARAAGPLTYVTPDYPPTLLLHGAADKVVPPSASMVMYEALVRAGVPAELHMYAEQPHGFVGDPVFIDQTTAEIGHFMRRYLKGAAVREEAAAAV